jgi:hypothetical protein
MGKTFSWKFRQLLRSAHVGIGSTHWSSKIIKMLADEFTTYHRAI